MAQLLQNHHLRKAVGDGQVYQRADAFLFGRRTYAIFAGYWGVMADSVDPIAAALNTRPKYALP